MTRRLKRILYSIGICSMASFAIGLWCGHAIWHQPTTTVPQPLDEISIDDELDTDEYDETFLPDSTTTSPDSVDYDDYLETMPEQNIVRLRVKAIGGTLPKVFNDSNNIHLTAATALGIKPIANIADAWNLRRPIVRIQSNEHYVVDRLTHSLPYLVPEAADLLDEIGRRFSDSLAINGGDYRIKVTSILRTPATVKRLRRINGNATSQSAHQYATTFDISYVNFACHASTNFNRTQQDLKNLLATVLFDLRAENRCYVKYERKQGCFHITARPSSDFSTSQPQ